MKNLISLLAYVMELPKDMLIQTRLFRIELYAHFLNQKLSDRYEVNGVMAHPNNRFIPCGLSGDSITEPEYYKHYGQYSNFTDSKFEDFFEDSNDFTEWNYQCEQYKQSKLRILFENFYWDGRFFTDGKIKIGRMSFENNKINQLLGYDNLQLTSTAQKLIGVSPN